MIVGVVFNDNPTMHQIMNAAGDNVMTVIRKHIDDQSMIPTDNQMLQILNLYELDNEYMAFISIYYDSGSNIEQFQRYALNRIKTIYNII